MRRARQFWVTLATAGVGAAACAGSAQAALEMRIPQPYVVAPGAATILLRSDVAGEVSLYQERPDRRYIVPGGTGTPGCFTPGSTNRPGYTEWGTPFARVTIDTPGVWVRVRVRAARLQVSSYTVEQFRYDVIRALVPQPKDLVAGSCEDPPTLYDGVVAFGPTSIEHGRLQRLL